MGGIECRVVVREAEPHPSAAALDDAESFRGVIRVRVAPLCVWRDRSNAEMISVHTGCHVHLPPVTKKSAPLPRQVPADACDCWHGYTGQFSRDR